MKEGNQDRENEKTKTVHLGANPADTSSLSREFPVNKAGKNGIADIFLISSGSTVASS